MSAIRAVTVYCSSSSDIDLGYMTAGRDMARGIAGQGWTLVFGGNYVGLMAAVADAARAAGGRVVGITPQLFVDRGMGDSACDELVVTAGMRERKELLEQRADAFVALPGGIGTFEELFEVWVGRQLGYHAKPIVLLDVDGYYQPFLAMIRHGLERQFIRPSALGMLKVVGTAAEAVEYLRHVEPSTPAPAPDLRADRLPSAIE